MYCLLRNAALILSAIVAGPATAQTAATGPPTPANARLPDWPIRGAFAEAAPAASSSIYAAPLALEPTDELPNDHSPAPRPGPAVLLTSHAAEETSPNTRHVPDDPRRLAPRGENRASPSGGSGRAASPRQFLPDVGLRLDSVYTTVCALALVVGVFFLFVWLLRRSGRKETAALPADVVGVLGQVTLGPKHTAQLLRVGGKLVLVALTPDGPTPLTEVTDPAEVDRLLGICHERDPHSATRAFEQVFRELARDTAANDLLSHETPLAGPPVAAAYGGMRGGASRG
jgi:flagellar biogenesis protein FliO